MAEIIQEKTTLSRIFRALETGSISDKYNSPEFQISFCDGSSVTHNSLNSHSQLIRVFNKDFVKENLRFIVDDEQTINSFAVLGKDNTKLEAEIEKYESVLGSEETKSGLLGEHLDANQKHKDIQKAHKEKLSELNRKLQEKANKRDTGIKHNKSFGDANYNVPKLELDINAVTKDS